MLREPRTLPNRSVIIALEVFNRCMETSRIIPEKANRDVANRTQQPADATCFVAMVHRKATRLARALVGMLFGLSANCADATLGGKNPLVVLWRDPVLRLQARSPDFGLTFFGLVPFVRFIANALLAVRVPVRPLASVPAQVKLIKRQNPLAALASFLWSIAKQIGRGRMALHRFLINWCRAGAEVRSSRRPSSFPLTISGVAT